MIYWLCSLETEIFPQVSSLVSPPANSWAEARESQFECLSHGQQPWAALSAVRGLWWSYDRSSFPRATQTSLLRGCRPCPSRMPHSLGVSLSRNRRIALPRAIADHTLSQKCSLQNPYLPWLLWLVNHLFVVKHQKYLEVCPLEVVVAFW